MMAKNIQQEAKSMEGPAGMTVTGGNPKFIFICVFLGNSTQAIGIKIDK